MENKNEKSMTLEEMIGETLKDAKANIFLCSFERRVPTMKISWRDGVCRPAAQTQFIYHL